MRSPARNLKAAGSTVMLHPPVPGAAFFHGMRLGPRP